MRKYFQSKKPESVIKKSNFSKQKLLDFLSFEACFTFLSQNSSKKSINNDILFFSNLSFGIFSQKKSNLKFLEKSWEIFSNNSFEWKSLQNCKKPILRMLKNAYLKKKSNKNMNFIEDFSHENCLIFYNFFKGILLVNLDNPNSIELYEEILKYKNLDDSHLEILLFSEFCNIQIRIFEEYSGKLLIFGKDFKEIVHFLKSIDKKLWILVDKNKIEIFEEINNKERKYKNHNKLKDLENYSKENILGSNINNEKLLISKGSLDEKNKNYNENKLNQLKFVEKKKRKKIFQVLVVKR